MLEKLNILSLKKTLPFLILLLTIVSCSNLNDPLPDFEVTSIEGATITDKDFEGKILVINIWATWCGPCVQELPELNKVVKHFENDEEIAFLAISDESNEKVARLLNRYPFLYQQVAEAKLLKHKLHPSLVKSIPFHVIIGKDGDTKLEYTGSKPNMSEFLISEIEKVKNL